MPSPKNSIRLFISGIILCTLVFHTLRLSADVLVYKNGDRINGSFIRKDGANFIFSSTRFGELTIPVVEATIEITHPPSVSTSVAPVNTAPATSPAPATQSTAVATKRWWKHWHGRLATSMGIDSDLTERSILAFEGKLLRNWKNDEIQLTVNYDKHKDTGIVTVDLFKASARYSHTFAKKWFAEYRANFERDPITSKASQLQQQIGAGRFLYKTEKRTVRLGVAENLFNTWPMSGGESTHVSVESVFVEATLTFPWRVTLTERGVFYFTFNNETDTGWENEFEISKKLSDAFSVGFRYEIRHNNPDPRVTDYQRTRFLLGYDF